MDRCEVKRCRADADLTFLGKGICTRHFDMYAAEDEPPGRLRVVLGLPPADAVATEENMDDGTSKKAEAAEAPAKTKGKKAKAPRKTKVTKEPTPKRQKVENPVVFAFRLSEADRTRIHEAAGSAKASSFVLAATMAAVEGDVEAFKRVVETRAK